MALKIVAENDEAELRRKQAIGEIGYPLRTLAANMLRSMRGAGEPVHLAGEMVAVLDAMQAYRDTMGHYPESHVLRSILNFRDDTLETRQISDGPREWALAEERVIAGALQNAASRLCHQRAQLAAGRHEMIEGIRVIEDIRSANALAIATAPAKRRKKHRKASSEFGL